MPTKITNELGEEVEVFTAEELQAQKDAVLEEYKQSNPDKTEELTQLQSDIRAKEEEIKKLKDKEHNFGVLKGALDKKDKELESLKSSLDEKIGTVKKEIFEGVMKDHYNDTLKRLVGDDKDLLAKVEFQYKRLADSASTKDEISKKINDAYLLATGTGKQDVSYEAFSSSGVGKLKIDSKTKLTDDEKKMAMELAAAGGMKLEEKDFIGK